MRTCAVILCDRWVLEYLRVLKGGSVILRGRALDLGLVIAARRAAVRQRHGMQNVFVDFLAVTHGLFAVSWLQLGSWWVALLPCLLSLPVLAVALSEPSSSYGGGL